MVAWWQSLSGFGQVMATIAICGSVLLVLQIVLLCFGLGGGADVDFDVDSPDFGDMFSLKALTFRGATAFLAVGGWTALLLESVMPAWAAGLLGAVAGIATAFLMAWVYSLFKRFETEGNVEIDDCLGKNALVYIPVPASGQGKGKINVAVRGTMMEYDAITRGDQSLSTNQKVTVVSKVDETTVEVRAEEGA